MTHHAYETFIRQSSDCLTTLLRGGHFDGGISSLGFSQPRETLCRWSISLCPSDGKREQCPSYSAWSSWCQAWSLSQGKAHHDYLPSTQITAAAFKLHFYHLCPGFTHSRNIMFVRKIGCYLMDTATVSQGLPTMDILPPPHWISIQAQGRLTSAWVIRDIILTVHRTLGTEMNKEYAVRGEDAVFTLGRRKNSLRVENPVVITWWFTCFVSVRRFENPGWKGHFCSII